MGFWAVVKIGEYQVIFRFCILQFWHIKLLSIPNCIYHFDNVGWIWDLNFPSASVDQQCCQSIFLGCLQCSALWCVLSMRIIKHLLLFQYFIIGCWHKITVFRSVTFYGNICKNIAATAAAAATTTTRTKMGSHVSLFSFFLLLYKLYYVNFKGTHYSKQSDTFP